MIVMLSSGTAMPIAMYDTFVKQPPIRPESAPTDKDITPITLDSLVPTFSKTARENRSMMPVLAMPCPKIMTAIIAITALLEKPESVSCGVSTRVHPNASMQTSATTSMRTTSKMSAIIVAMRIIRTVLMAGSILKVPILSKVAT
jgi:hypothetical protein